MQIGADRFKGAQSLRDQSGWGLLKVGQARVTGWGAFFSWYSLDKVLLERNQESVELYPKQVDPSWFKSRTLPHKGPLQPPKVLAVLFSAFMSFCLFLCLFCPESQAAQSDLKLTMYPRLPLNS